MNELPCQGIDYLRSEANASLVGEEMYRLIADLYPICRSITGDGVRQTLEALRRHASLEVTRC